MHPYAFKGKTLLIGNGKRAEGSGEMAAIPRASRFIPLCLGGK